MKRITMILMLASFILGSTRATAQTNTLQVWMDETLTMTADGATVMKLTVSEYDPNVDYTSFNMTIRLPKGIRVNVISGREVINDITLNDQRKKNDHTIQCEMQEDYTLRIIATSMTNSSFYHDDTEGNIINELFTVGLVCDASAINGEYKIELTDCVFNVVDGDNVVDHKLDHTEYSTLTITGGTVFAGVDYTLSDYRCGTLTLPCDCAVPSGMEVYSCEGVSADNVLQMNAVSTIAANTPYIVRGTPGTYTFNGTYKALKDSYSTEYMTGVLVETAAPEGSYVMQNHVGSHGIGFYRVGSVEAKVPAYRAYVNAQESGARMFTMRFNGTTGVEALPTEHQQPVNVYTMQGIAVKRGVEKAHALDNLPRGIYIVDGKRYVVTNK